MLNAVPLLLALTASQQSSVADSESDDTYTTTIMTGIGAAGGKQVGGLAASFLALQRVEFVEMGAELYGAALFSSMGSAGAVAGVHWGSDFSLRLLAAGGVHFYNGVGVGLLSDDPGVSGSTPYVGGRAIVGYSFGKDRRSFLGLGRLFVGLAGGLDQDLRRQRKSVSYLEEDWFGGGLEERTAEHTIGQTTWAALAVAGWELDLLN